MAWDYALRQGGTLRIIIPDMGHGNCIGLFEEKSGSLLIDCGAENTIKETNFRNLVKSELDKAAKRDLIITHYHTDHHNLLRSFPSNFFENIYLPRLPARSSAAQVILQFVALAIAQRYQDYYLIPGIMKYAKQIHPLIKGEHFNAFNKDWDVLWPDYKIIDEKNVRKIQTVREVIEASKANLTREQRDEFEKWLNILSTAFSDRERPEIPPQESIPDKPIHAEVQKALESVEDVFTHLANRTSLVVRDNTPVRFLFTGDIDNSILNNYLFFGNQDYTLIEAPHHGGYYGTAFDNVFTQVLVISRKETYKPRCEYFRDLSWNNLVDTPRNGNCTIRC
jgi:beta-lactamase superfamily II metal-dependent hydrolase